MTPSRAWSVAGASTAAALLALVLVFRGTALSLVGIWWRSETFAHCFFVPPTTAYLIWRRRAVLARITPRPSRAALGAMLLLTAAWLVGDAAGVLVARQAAFVAMLAAAAWAILGTAVMRAILFPVAFLFFAVPAGEILVPPLMDFTGRFAVVALRWSGVPVAMEGNVLRVPNATWQVAEACSGFRYLMASVMVGTLYAYLMYRSARRRAAFVAASILMPIPANGVRAYLIVLIGYLSDMKLAVGIDHYLYGWVLFTIGIAALFWIGSWWRESPAPEMERPGPGGGAGAPSGPLALAAAAALALAVGALGPIGSGALDRLGPTDPPSVTAPAPAGDWKPDPLAAGTWRPDFVRPAAAFSGTYRRGGDVVGVWLFYYRGQREGAELLSTQNALVATTNRTWRRGETRRLDPPAGAVPFQIRETIAYSDLERVRIRDWYWILGERTSSLMRAKIAQGAFRLAGRGDDAALVAIFTPDGDAAAATRRLGEFARDMLPSIESSLRAAHGGRAGGGS
ncbi:MAG TPA: exosortase A [Candidatus Eisenbacteria bacterium]